MPEQIAIFQDNKLSELQCTFGFLVLKITYPPCVLGSNEGQMYNILNQNAQ